MRRARRHDVAGSSRSSGFPRYEACFAGAACVGRWAPPTPSGSRRKRNRSPAVGNMPSSPTKSRSWGSRHFTLPTTADTSRWPKPKDCSSSPGTGRSPGFSQMLPCSLRISFSSNCPVTHADVYYRLGISHLMNPWAIQVLWPSRIQWGHARRLVQRSQVQSSTRA